MAQAAPGTMTNRVVHFVQMSAKPSDLPVWSTDLVYSSGPESGELTKIEPSGAFQAEGWKPATYPRPEYFNWFMNLTYLWCQYLSDGDFDGPVTVDGLLTATDVTVTDDLVVGDDASIAGELTVTSGIIYHGEILVPQAFVGYLGTLTAGVTSNIPIFTLATGLACYVPIKFPIVSAVHRVKKMSVAFKNTVSVDPTIQLLIVPEDFNTAASLLTCTHVTTVIAGTASRREGTVITPQHAGPRGVHWIKITNNGAGDLDMYNLAVTVDAVP